MDTHPERIVAFALLLAIFYLAPLTTVLRRLGLVGWQALLLAILLVVPAVNGVVLFVWAISGWPRRRTTLASR